MTDRVPGAPGQYQAVVTAQALEKMQAGQAFTITLTRDDQPITPGTPYSKAAVLPDTLAQTLCPNNEDPTPADALQAVWKKGLACRTFVPDGTDLNGFFQPGMYRFSSDSTYKHLPLDKIPRNNIAYLLVLSPFGEGDSQNGGCCLQIVMNYDASTRLVRSVWYENIFDWKTV